MPVAAVPAYMGTDFKHASPAMRFGMYLQVWEESFSLAERKVELMQRAAKLNQHDLKTMQHLLQRQQAIFNALSDHTETLQLDALASAPFTTGLGNEHPLENGFAFLNPYGLPYLPGSGVKGVLRQAARELASGDWGECRGWSKEVIDVLFGPENREDEGKHQRGALRFWDVIPQIQDNDLQVEIMTPHQQHYYQKGQTPHDCAAPMPIVFLTVPPGTGFTFYVLCDRFYLQQLAAELADQDQWKRLMQAAFEHAFEWLGFGAKTAVGYGAMKEDEEKKAEREAWLKQQREEKRRAELTPEERAYEDNMKKVQWFREVFERAQKQPYQPGQEFDARRYEFIDEALGWDEPRSRREAATLLRETLKWGVSKKGKDRLKAAVTKLEGLE